MIPGKAHTKSNLVLIQEQQKPVITFKMWVTIPQSYINWIKLQQPHQSTFLTTVVSPFQWAYLFSHYTDEEFHFIFAKNQDGTFLQGPAVQLMIKSDISELCEKLVIFLQKNVQCPSSKSILSCFQLSLCAFISNCGDIMHRKYRYLSWICIQFWLTLPLIFALKR